MKRHAWGYDAVGREVARTILAEMPDEWDGVVAMTTEGPETRWRFYRGGRMVECIAPFLLMGAPRVREDYLERVRHSFAEAEGPR